jgi:hypothetical protein
MTSPWTHFNAPRRNSLNTHNTLQAMLLSLIKMCVHYILSKIKVEQLAFLFRIREVLSLNCGIDIGYFQLLLSFPLTLYVHFVL